MILWRGSDFLRFLKIKSSEQDFKDLYWTISKILLWNLFTWKGIYMIDWVGRIGMHRTCCACLLLYACLWLGMPMAMHAYCSMHAYSLLLCIGLDIDVFVCLWIYRCTHVRACVCVHAGDGGCGRGNCIYTYVTVPMHRDMHILQLYAHTATMCTYCNYVHILQLCAHTATMCTSDMAWPYAYVPMHLCGCGRGHIHMCLCTYICATASWYA